MNRSNRSRSHFHFSKPAVLALALALSGVAAAANMNDSVTTRADQNIAQQHGRDSIYALSPDPVYAAAQVEPQRYGRAGGYTGTDRIELFKSGAATGSAAQTSDVGRTAVERFDNPDSAHGQGETGVQTR